MILLQELRKDYILDKWVITSKNRGNRPIQFKEQKKESKTESKNCFFCPGNENTTPTESYRWVDEVSNKSNNKGKWAIRAFPNKFAAVSLDKFPEKKKRLFSVKSAYGHHEVIVDIREHKKQLHDKDVNHFYKLIDVWCDRIDYFQNRKGIKYVILWKNHLREAGTSLIHSHCQLIAYNQEPVNIKEKTKAVVGYKRKYFKCPYCDIIEKEIKLKERLAFENKSFVAICPYASFYAHEIMILSKRCVKSILDLTEIEKKDLAKILKKVLFKLGKNNVPYNLEVNNGLKGKPFHFHISVTPREFKLAGFEIGTGTIINSVSPEDAKRWYRSR